MSNFLAEVVDTFFNGRPAPSDAPKTFRIRLTRRQARLLRQGETLRFKCGSDYVLLNIAEMNQEEGQKSGN